MTSLLVAASGGHLAQLHRLARRLDAIEEDRVWVTFDGPQSRSLLEGEKVVFVPYVGPRDLRMALRNTWRARKILTEYEPNAVVSTGSAVAMSFLPLARLRGIPTIYVESAARADGPSLTGRLLQRVPGVQRFSQYRMWADDTWRYVGSVFDGFKPVPATAPPVGRPLKIVVTFGLIEGYGFRRLVERLLAILPADAEVLWQVGDTDMTGLTMTACRSLPWLDLTVAMKEADVVVAHTGIGSAIDAMECGKCPVLVPREARHGEHVDDHQRQIAAELAAAGLAIYRSAEELTFGDLRAAMEVRVEELSDPPMIHTLPADRRAA
ncbi:glycosyltransferase [Baekduia sp.]|jgi:UDP-N-acetylglucosamine transferase subunit ALG13|uniref:glycosyltransferase n=1 Tax=Baekduia sp. TaxID=2600305 RepID=UPI002DFEBE86|nr:glycosyltransferase [Baekduia sp.]